MADEQVMPTSDMLNELAKMENLFRTVQNAKAVVQGVNSMEGRKVELEAQIKDLEDKKNAANASFIETTDALLKKQEVLKEFEASLDAKMTEAKQKFDKDMADLGVHYSETSVAARDKVAQDLKDEQAKVDELVAQKSDLQRDVRLLQAEIETLTQKKAAI